MNKVIDFLLFVYLDGFFVEVNRKRIFIKISILEHESKTIKTNLLIIKTARLETNINFMNILFLLIRLYQ